MRYIAVVSLLILLSVPTPVPAQGDNCPEIVEEAISATAKHCTHPGANEVCLGHADVDAVVNCETPPNFSASGDIIPLEAVCSLRVGAMQPSGQWGIAKMQMSATASDQHLTYLLFGEVEIHNVGSATSTQEVLLTTDTQVYSGPGSHYDIIGRLTADTKIQANACNCTGNWLRTVLADGQVGWIPARNGTLLGETSNLPIVKADTPVYAPMQAFTLRSGQQHPLCSQAPENGILLQVSDAHEERLQINGVEIALNSTVFIQSHPNDSLTLNVLDGYARVTVENFTALIPAGARASIPMSADNHPTGKVNVEPYTAQDVAHLPLSLLPKPVEPLVALSNESPSIVGLEPCNVISDSGDTVCPLSFINSDGDAISHMNIEFVYAPQGEWAGSTQSPELVGGDSVSGQLGWNVSCSLGAANFIGPVRWSITITDVSGKTSQPFEAAFNCVPG